MIIAGILLLSPLTALLIYLVGTILVVVGVVVVGANIFSRRRR